MFVEDVMPEFKAMPVPPLPLYHPSNRVMVLAMLKYALLNIWYDMTIEPPYLCNMLDMVHFRRLVAAQICFGMDAEESTQLFLRL